LVTSRLLRKHGRHLTRRLHHYAARLPHEYLTIRLRWYRRWHNWQHHQRVHAAVLTADTLLVGAIVFGNYQKTLALSDLLDSWNFSTPSQFSVDSGVEISGNSARLKAQNYATDANTQALYHFDESSGGSASDSSGNGNNAAVSGATFGAGNLNNALS